jgi:hypothetical protein
MLLTYSFQLRASEVVHGIDANIYMHLVTFHLLAQQSKSRLPLTFLQLLTIP